MLCNQLLVRINACLICCLILPSHFAISFAVSFAVSSDVSFSHLICCLILPSHLLSPLLSHLMFHFPVSSDVSLPVLCRMQRAK